MSLWEIFHTLVQEQLVSGRVHGALPEVPAEEGVGVEPLNGEQLALQVKGGGGGGGPLAVVRGHSRPPINVWSPGKENVKLPWEGRF